METPIAIAQEGLQQGLYTDYDLAVIGRTSFQHSDGQFIRSGATKSDLASITKTLINMAGLVSIEEGRLNPLTPIREYLPVKERGGGGRTLAHSMCGGMKGYGWEYNASNEDEFAQDIGRFREAILSRGFSRLTCEHEYDNVNNIYFGLVLEEEHGSELESVIKKVLPFNGNATSLYFHPVTRGIWKPEDVIPTSPDLERGRVHDPLSYQHRTENIAVAGAFSDAETLAKVTHEVLSGFTRSFYSSVNRKWLNILHLKPKTKEDDWGLGWDKPAPHRFDGKLEQGLIFTGFTGGRLLHGYVKGKPITIAFLPNHSYCRTKENNPEFRALWWRLANAVVDMHL